MRDISSFRKQPGLSLEVTGDRVHHHMFAGPPRSLPRPPSLSSTLNLCSLQRGCVKALDLIAPPPFPVN